MPHPLEVRRLGDRWETLKHEVGLYALNIPVEGVTRPDFERACLQGITLDARDVIVDSLRRAKIIFLARQGVEWRVFGVANGRRLADPNADPLLNQFVAGVGAPMLRLAKLAALGADADARANQRAVVGDVAGFVRRYVDRGGSLPKARDALWAAFSPDALALVARYEPALARDSDQADVAPTPPKARRLSHSLDPLQRIHAMICNAGKDGINKSAVYKSFAHPRPGQVQVDAWLDEIVSGGGAHSVMCKLNRMGRPGRRFFSAEQDAPSVQDGVLVRD